LCLVPDMANLAAECAAICFTPDCWNRQKCRGNSACPCTAIRSRPFRFIFANNTDDVATLQPRLINPSDNSDRFVVLTPSVFLASAGFFTDNAISSPLVVIMPNQFGTVFSIFCGLTRFRFGLPFIPVPRYEY